MISFILFTYYIRGFATGQLVWQALSLAKSEYSKLLVEVSEWENTGEYLLYLGGFVAALAAFLLRSRVKYQHKQN